MRAAGALTLFMATAVLVGWFARIAPLVQLGSEMAPIQPNAALALALAGLALFLEGRDAGRIAAGAAASIGALTVLEYVLATPLGIDRLLVDPFLTAQTTHPGRMAAITAIAHLFLGTCLALPREGRVPLRLLLLETVAALGAFGALHATFGAPFALRWGETARMALPEGLWFVAVAALVGSAADPRERLGAITVPLAVHAVGIATALAAWLALLDQRGTWLQSVAEDTVDTSTEVVRDELAARLSSLRSVADEWISGQEPPTQAWRSEGLQQLRAYPSLTGFVWVDEEGAAGWELLARGARPGLQRVAQKQAWPTGRVQAEITDEDPPRLLVAAPLVATGEHRGHLVAAIAADRLVEQLAPEIGEDFDFELSRRGVVLGRSGELTPHVVERRFELFGDRTWRLRVSPRPLWMTVVRTGLSELFLVTGLGLSLAFALALHLQRVADGALRDLQRSHDLLERRVSDRTEALQQANETLARTNEDLDHFASLASHDLKEPLRTMSAYVGLLARRHGHLLDAQGREWLDVVETNLRRMLDLVDGLLAWARASSPQPRDIDLPSVIDGVLGSLSVSLAEADAEVDVQHPLPRVCADPIHLAQILQNLITNALKFRGEARPRVEIAARASDDEVEIRVSDNGVGMTPDTASQIFEMFRRAPDQAHRPGTGIGLSICKRLVEAQGGRIRVESSPGVGSTFRFTLPRGGMPAGRCRTSSHP